MSNAQKGGITIASLVLVLGVSACVPPAAIYWDMSLKQVDRPASARARYGAQLISTDSDSGRLRQVFEDSLVRIAFSPGESSMHFALQNKTDYSIKIVWDEAAMVLPDGQSQPVMHEGVKFAECSASKPPSVVVKRGQLIDVAIPCRGVMLRAGSWERSPIIAAFPETYSDERVLRNAARKLTKDNQGKTVQLLLPLQIETTVNEYLFTLRVDSAYVVTRKR